MTDFEALKQMMNKGANYGIRIAPGPPKILFAPVAITSPEGGSATVQFSFDANDSLVRISVLMGVADET